MKKPLFLISLSLLFISYGEPIKSLMAAKEIELLSYDDEDQIPLPDGVVAVEYIESTGTQFIDTGIVGNERLIIDSDWSYGASDASAKPFGSRIAANSRAIAVTGWSGTIDHRLYLNYGSNSGYIDYNGSNLYGHIWEIHVENGNSRLIRDGLVVSTGVSSMPAFTTPSSLILFGGYNNGNITYSRNVRIYSWAVRDVNTQLQDFIPVRFTNEDGETEGAMYDIISEELFRNQGTGSFIIGPDKQ